MSGITLALDMQNMPEVLDVFEQLKQASQDLSPVWDDIGEYFVHETAERFLTGTAPDGTYWEPSQRALNESGTTLVDHAHLRDSFTWNADPDSFEFGTNMIYAGIHQKGGKTGRNHSVDMPVRQILPEELRPEDEAEILSIVNKHLTNALR